MKGVRESFHGSHKGRELDASLFTSPTGELVRLSDEQNPDYAFVPDRLPPDWQPDRELLGLVAEAREVLGTLNGIGQGLPDARLLLAPLQKREALTSSSLEGTYATPEEVLRYELSPKEHGRRAGERADWIEVFAYDTALRAGVEMLAELPICLRLIRRMHYDLMRDASGLNKAPGEFRRWQVKIGHNARFVPPPPQRLHDLLADFERYANGTEGVDPLIRCFIAHYQFEAIHPFSDGNGRVGRALLALMIYSIFGHSHPWLYMSAFFERYKDEYIGKLFRVSTAGAWDGWIEFCLRGVISQGADSVRRCHRFNHLKEKFSDAVPKPTPRTHKIVASLFTNQLLSVRRVQDLCDGVAYNTAKKDIDVLVEAGVVSELEGQYPKLFYCPELMRAAYGESHEIGDGVEEDRSPPFG